MEIELSTLVRIINRTPPPIKAGERRIVVIFNTQPRFVDGELNPNRKIENETMKLEAIQTRLGLEWVVTNISFK